MRWRAVLERIEQKAELELLLVRADGERLEHGGLHIGAVDPHRTTADLIAVDGEVVGLGQARARIGVQQADVVVLGRGERVVAGVPTLLVFVVLEHREVDDPAWCPGAAVQMPLLVADLGAQGAERVVDHLGAVSAKEDQIAVLRAGAAHDLAQRGGIEVLDDGRLQAGLVELRDVVDLDVREALGAVDLDELGVAVDLASAERCPAGYAHRRDTALGVVGRAAEHLEGDVLDRIGYLGELEGHA